MFIDINEIDGEGLTFDESLEVADLEGSAGETIPVPASRLTGTAKRGHPGVDLVGRLTATVRLECGRCLEPFEYGVDTDFFLTLVPDETTAGGAEGVDEDASFFHAPGGKADLALIATEQIYLSLPLKPVCRDDCKGLCVMCGANRNMVECGCEDEVVDPRLAPLAELKTRLSDS